MTQQQAPNPFKEIANAFAIAADVLFYSVYPLRLFSRKLGTVGASYWFPGIIWAFFLMMFVTEIFGGRPSMLAWWFSSASFYMLIAHIVCYLHQHKKGNYVYPYALGVPRFFSGCGGDVFVAVVFAVVSTALGEGGFAFWWWCNVPLSVIAHQMIVQRDNARKRRTQGALIENAYWKSMIDEEYDHE